MEIYERVRILRKHLNLSQTEFGKRLGVNRDVINNIENNRLAKADQKLSLFKLMCKEFAVSEDWLLTGAEPMFVQPDTFSLDRFITEHGATDLEREIVKTYFELPLDIRQVVMEHFRKRFLGSSAAVPVMAPVEEDAEETAENGSQLSEEEIEDRVANYRSLLKREQRMRRQYETERLLLGNDSETWTDPNVTGGKASSGSAG